MNTEHLQKGEYVYTKLMTEKLMENLLLIKYK